MPVGELILCISTASMFSLRAALDKIGSIITMPWNPPGWLCETRGEVFVITLTPRIRMAGG